jgi:hypothetical protein
MMLSEDTLEDAVLEEMGKRFTEALAQSMGATRDAIMGEILMGKDYEIEVDFEK